MTNISHSFYPQDGGKNHVALTRNKITPLSAYVYERGRAGKPQWRERPRRVNATVGDTVSLRCRATSTPPPTVRWYVNNNDDLTNASSSAGACARCRRVYESGEYRDDCLWVCLRAYLWNDTCHLHQLTCACCPWPSLGPPLAA